jgi:hypothetical protein
MSGAGGRKRGFDFAPIAERRKRKMAGVPLLVIKATRGHREPLIEYLSGGPQLSKDDSSWLAWLIEQYDELIKRKLRRNGRPRGSITPKTAATECASCLVRMGKAAWCRKHRRKRAPTALTQGLIKRAIELMEAEIPKARGKVSAEAVKDRSYLRPDPKTEEYICIDLEEARWEIIELARNNTSLRRR